MIKKCLYCQEIFRTYPSNVNRGQGKICSNKCKSEYMMGRHLLSETKMKIGLAQRGNKNHQWKGNGASYKAIHSWISKNMGQPPICYFCGSTVNSRYEWANISGKYRREATDWYRLCVSCHRKLDWQEKYRERNEIGRFTARRIE